MFAAAAKSLHSCPTLCDPRDGSPPRLPHPWDSPGKNTGVGCHCLLQCRKVKSESEGAQSCPTLSNAMDCSLPGSSVHRIFQARVLEWGASAFCFGFWPQGMWDISSPTRDQTHTPCIGRQSLNHWTAREVPRTSVLTVRQNLVSASSSKTFQTPPTLPLQGRKNNFLCTLLCS